MKSWVKYLGSGLEGAVHYKVLRVHHPSTVPGVLHRDLRVRGDSPLSKSLWSGSEKSHPEDWRESWTRSGSFTRASIDMQTLYGGSRQQSLRVGHRGRSVVGLL